MRPPLGSRMRRHVPPSLSSAAALPGSAIWSSWPQLVQTPTLQHLLLLLRRLRLMRMAMRASPLLMPRTGPVTLIMKFLRGYWSICRVLGSLGDLKWMPWTWLNDYSIYPEMCLESRVFLHLVSDPVTPV